MVIDKPHGMTSRTAVNRVQRWFPRRTRVGHTGTLDPLATGIMVMCLGTATRLAEYVQEMPKTYRAGLLFGVRSTTDDLEGTVTKHDLGQAIDQKGMQNALSTFVGEIEQVPPNFSAAKMDGRRAYDLARRGRTVLLHPRMVTIHGIDIVDFDFPRVELEVRCGKGTYIRSLARDLGEKLGCGALIEKLRRTRVGPFGEEDAVPLDMDSHVAHQRLLPTSATVAHLAQVVVDIESERLLRQGQAITLPSTADRDKLGKSPKCAVVTRDGGLIAVCTWDAEKHQLWPSKVISEV
jgi:tRNA pseudouridine55 synthase